MPMPLQALNVALAAWFFRSVVTSRRSYVDFSCAIAVLVVATGALGLAGIRQVSPRARAGCATRSQPGGFGPGSPGSSLPCPNNWRCSKNRSQA